MTEPTAETPPTADPEPGRITTIDALASKVDRLAELVAKVIPGSHAQAEQRVEERLDRPSTVEEQVKAELDKAKREEAERAAREARDADDKQLRETVAKLAEKPPEPPVRRATRLLGWGP